MRELGAHVTRSAGSKGLWDVTAVFPRTAKDRGAVWLIQVKITSRGSWRDANWRTLRALAPALPCSVTAVAFVYRRGKSMPLYIDARTDCERG